MASETVKAGRELDAAISEAVFGKPVIGWWWAFCPEGSWCFLPSGDFDGAKQPVFVDSCYGDHGDCEADFLGEKAFYESLGHGRSCCDVVPCYSSDIFAAFLVVERMRELGWDCFELKRMGCNSISAEFWAYRSQPVNADTAAEAICLAALAALRQGDKQGE